MTEPLLLEAGYGAMQGPGMTLLSRHGPVHPEMESILLAYSCHRAALPKIRQCLELSGRYDCWVQAGWIYGQYKEIKSRLAEIDIRLMITSIPEWDLSRQSVRAIPIEIPKLSY